MAASSPWIVPTVACCVPPSRICVASVCFPLRWMPQVASKLEFVTKPRRNLISCRGIFSLRGISIVSDHDNIERKIRPFDSGFKVLAMRHGKRVPKLNRPSDQRKALLRGLTTQLLKHGRIKTTVPRAKAMRKCVEKMITLAKDGSLHKRRQALGFVYQKTIVHALFAEVKDRYGDRNGGYTRILKTFPRKGDNAPMAYIELV